MTASMQLRAIEGEIAEINAQPLPVSTNRKNTKRKAALCDVLLTIAKELEKERDELTETKKTNEHLERRLQVAENTIRGTTDQYHLTRKERDSLRIERDTISRFNETNRRDAESLKSQLVDALAENATLKRRLDEAMKENEQTKALIDKSNLEEVASVQCVSDGCGAPVLRPSGTILRHRGYMKEVEEKTNLLRKLAASARKIHELETRITEIDKL